MTAAESDVLEIREATRADIAQLMEAHRVAFVGSMGASLGEHYRRAFVTTFVIEPDQIALLAVRNEKVVGYVLGRAVGAPTRGRATLIAIIIGLLSRPWLLLRRNVRHSLSAQIFHQREMAKYHAALPADGGDLVGIGCVPAERGRGTAKALIIAFEDWCVRKGWGSVQLSVYRENESARHLYASAGYEERMHACPALRYEYKVLAD